MRLKFWDQNSLFKNNLKNNLVYFLIGYGVIFFFNFCRIIIFTHIFKPEELGIYAIVNSVILYVDIIFFAWINGTAWRFVFDKKYDSFATLLESFFPILCYSFILAGFSIYIITLFIFTAYQTLLLLCFFSTFSSSLLILYFNYLIAFKSIKSWCKVIVIQTLGTLLLLFLLIGLTTISIFHIYLSTLLFNIFLIIYLGIKYWNKLQLLKLKNIANIEHYFFSYSLLLVLTNILLTILNNGDRFLIDFFKGKVQLGLYTQYYALASVGFYSLVQGFNNLLLPPFNKSMAKGEETGIPASIIQAYILIFTPLSCFLIRNSEYLTNFILGDNFKGYTPVFDWAIAGIYLFGFANFLEIKLKFENKIKVIVLVLFLVTIFNLILNGVLLKTNDIIIAALITFWSYLILTFALVIVNWKFVKSLRLERILSTLFLFSSIYIITDYLLKQYTNQNNLILLFLNVIMAGIFYIFISKRYLYIFRNCMHGINNN